MNTAITGILLGVLLGGTLLQAESTISISVREPWSNVFGGKESTFHVSVTGPNAFSGRLGWQLAADGRTLVRGDAEIKVSPTAPGEVVIRIPVPEVKPGVILQTRLSVLVLDGNREAGHLEKTLWVFPENALSDRSEWLKALRLSLFDPIGKTAKLFDGLGIPYSGIRAVDTLSEVKDGVVIIGEGVSFKDYRGLSGGMLKAVASGVSVLCLAPAAGEIELPSSVSGDLSRPIAMEFQREIIIRKLDKRLDPEGWAPDGQSMACGLAFRGERGPVIAEVGSATDGWPWIELGYAKNNAKFVVCGFGIVGKWADSPTPRYLLVKMLETLRNKEE